MIATSVSGGDYPREAAVAAIVLYILCAGSIGPQPVVLGAVGEEQGRVVGRQQRGAVVPPLVRQVTHQVQQVAPSVRHLHVLGLHFFWTWLRLHNRLEYFLKMFKTLDSGTFY